jgi:sugar O-acyltransferase (sialic acid O-acetyltransferase NeuD family)
MKKVILFGNGQMAEIAHTFLTYDSDYEVVAFTVDESFMGKSEFMGLPVVPFERVQDIYPPDKYVMFVLLGGKDCNRFRESKYEAGKTKGYEFISYISSTATILQKSEIGENCFILEDNVIQPFVKIGNNCVLWSGNHIGHHSVIADHCYLASHIVVSGGVTIKSHCYLGVNATLRDHIVIAEGTIVGAGALIMKSTEQNSVFVGIRAKKLPVSSLKVNLP